MSKWFAIITASLVAWLISWSVIDQELFAVGPGFSQIFLFLPCDCPACYTLLNDTKTDWISHPAVHWLCMWPDPNITTFVVGWDETAVWWQVIYWWDNRAAHHQPLCHGIALTTNTERLPQTHCAHHLLYREHILSIAWRMTQDQYH